MYDKTREKGMIHKIQYSVYLWKMEGGGCNQLGSLKFVNFSIS